MLLLLVYCGRTELGSEEQDEREIEALIACQDEMARRLRLSPFAGGDWAPDVVTHLGGDRYRVDSFVDEMRGEDVGRRTHFTCGVVHTDENDWRIYTLDTIP